MNSFDYKMGSDASFNENNVKNKLESNANFYGLREAMFYEILPNNKVRCNLCPKRCIISEGKSGFCLIRMNINGKLYVKDDVVAMHIDPIEKKPLFHFYPFQPILSLATSGCNFDCLHCQNYEISRRIVDGERLTGTQIVDLALKHNIPMIAFTYNEPTVFFELMLETAKYAKENDIKTVMVSNGFINEEPLLQLIPYLDAANIDLKAFNNKFYTKIAKGFIEPVKRTIELLVKHGVWIEVTFLVIPTLNDDFDEAEKMFKWLSEFNVPLHITRFYPMRYLKHLPPTPISTLEKMYSLAKKYLDFVYVGNVLSEKENTYCPKCGRLLIDRFNLKFKTKCECGYELPGRF